MSKKACESIAWAMVSAADALKGRGQGTCTEDAQIWPGGERDGSSQVGKATNLSEFAYTAFDDAGRKISGTVEAEDAEAAMRQLTEQGSYVIDVVPATGKAPRTSSFRSPFSSDPWPSEITQFTRELELLLTSGQNLARALSLIEEDTSSRRIKALSTRLRQSVAAGRSFEEALRMEQRSFPPVYIGMVKAAEATGEMAGALAHIADMRERQEKLWAQVNSALLYPSLLIATAIAAVLLLMVVVVPRFGEMLGDQVDNLPATSKAVFATSRWLSENFDLFGICVAGLLLVLLLGLRQPAIRKSIERMLLRVPLLSTLIRMALSARFCRTLGGLTAAGVGLPAALALTRDTFANENARQLIDRIGTAVREGRDFTDPMGSANLFPLMLVSMLKIGASSGALSQTALRLADMYETKLQISIQRVVSVLEPTIILVVSIFCGFIVLSVVSAILGVYDLAGG